MLLTLINLQIIRKVRLNTSRILLQHRRDHNAVAKEELMLDAERIRVVRVYEEQRIDRRVASLILSVHCGVQVVEELIAHIDCLAASVGDERPSVEFLYEIALLFVVAVEGVELR